ARHIEDLRRSLLDVARGYAEKSLGDEFARHLCYGFVGFLLLAPLVFGNQDRTTYRRFLRTRPVRWTGEVSYGIYLWHFLVMRLVLERWTDLTFWPLLGATFAVTFVIASLSFVLLERPVQRLRLHRLLPSSGRRPVPGGEDGEGATGPDGRGGGSRAAAPTSTRGGPPP
ncbi:MAG TPA: acyltransferase, partial [Acidimicrobiales bacterium]|nr:acyltransferase [Acidimicrobiales bacterium]